MAQSSRPIADLMQTDTLVEDCSRLSEQVETYNKALIASLREASNTGWDFVGRLSRCRDPFEAGRVCDEWLGAQHALMLGEGRRLSELFLALCDTGLGAPIPRTARGPAPAERPDRAAAAAE